MHLTLDLGSGHDLKVVRSSSMLGSMLNGESAWDSHFPSFLFAPPLLHVCSLTLSQIHNFKKYSFYLF